MGGRARAEAIGSVEREYYRTYGETRDAVLAAGETGECKISGSDYVDRATTGINSILRLADAIGAAADQEAANEAAKSTSNLIVNGAILLACVGLALVRWLPPPRR
jgi:methyl-accepting chemotaxis protein